MILGTSVVIGNCHCRGLASPGSRHLNMDATFGDTRGPWTDKDPTSRPSTAGQKFGQLSPQKEKQRAEEQPKLDNARRLKHFQTHEQHGRIADAETMSNPNLDASSLSESAKHMAPPRRGLRKRSQCARSRTPQLRGRTLRRRRTFPRTVRLARADCWFVVPQ